MTQPSFQNLSCTRDSVKLTRRHEPNFVGDPPSWAFFFERWILASCLALASIVDNINVSIDCDPTIFPPVATYRRKAVIYVIRFPSTGFNMKLGRGRDFWFVLMRLSIRTRHETSSIDLVLPLFATDGRRQVMLPCWWNCSCTNCARDTRVIFLPFLWLQINYSYTSGSEMLRTRWAATCAVPANLLGRPIMADLRNIGRLAHRRGSRTSWLE